MHLRCGILFFSEFPIEARALRREQDGLGVLRLHHEVHGGSAVAQEPARGEERAFLPTTKLQTQALLHGMFSFSTGGLRKHDPDVLSQVRRHLRRGLLSDHEADDQQQVCSQGEKDPVSVMLRTSSTKLVVVLPIEKDISYICAASA